MEAAFSHGSTTAAGGRFQGKARGRARRTVAYPAPALVTLHVWGVRPLLVPAAVAGMATSRALLRMSSLGRRPGPTFTKLLGTGRGRTFTVSDADPRHWALLSTWNTDTDADTFDSSPTVRAWDRIAGERLTVRLRPLSSRGTWAGREPFGAGPAAGAGGHPRGPVASLTRARLRWRTMSRFWTAVPPVADDLSAAHGLRLALGIGEAPIALMGTFSIWTDENALAAFAHRGLPHREVMARTPRERWYAEELFARFAVEAVEGTYRGRTP